VKLSQFLSEFYGIKTRADLYAWLRKNAKPNQSNYQIMVRAWGERNADKVMRAMEVRECHQALGD
jgi:hypothetical protein